MEYKGDHQELLKQLLKFDEEQREIDEVKRNLWKAEALLKRIRTVDVTHTKTWFDDIDYYFEHKLESIVEDASEPSKLLQIKPSMLIIRQEQEPEAMKLIDSINEDEKTMLESPYGKCHEYVKQIELLKAMIRRGINENTSHYSSTWEFDARELINTVNEAGLASSISDLGAAIESIKEGIK